MKKKKKKVYRYSKRKHQHYRLKYSYGLSLEEYESVLKFYKFRCIICHYPHKKRRLVVDHHHKTKMLRGLICHHCNTGLGHFRDSEMLLKRAIAYLKLFNPRGRIK